MRRRLLRQLLCHPMLRHDLKEVTYAYPQRKQHPYWAWKNMLVYAYLSAVPLGISRASGVPDHTEKGLSG